MYQRCYNEKVHEIKPWYKDCTIWDGWLDKNTFYDWVNDGNFYEIWLQDADAVNDEMSIIREYDLAGVASWKAGFESGPEIFKIISSGLSQ